MKYLRPRARMKMLVFSYFWSVVIMTSEPFQCSTEPGEHSHPTPVGAMHEENLVFPLNVL